MTAPTKPTLRGLAKLLDVSHSALSKAAHDRLLTDGIGFDHRGRVVVTNADAAFKQWLCIHVPRVDAMARRQAAPVNACRCVILDRDGFDWRAQELLAAVESYELAIRALLRVRLEAGEDPGAIIASTSPRLRAEAQDPGDSFTDADVARAELSLATTLELLTESDDDDETDDEPRSDDDDR